MQQIVNENKINFYDDSNILVMSIDYRTDECTWFFKNSDAIIIKEDDALFEPLKYIMSQEYNFDSEELLKSYKTSNKLVWYSDCYYNPDDEWSKNNVSYLTIEVLDGVFKIYATKPLDTIIDRRNKSHIIAFSPLGNGKNAQNTKTGLTLQDEFVILVYQKLLQKEKIKKLHL